MIRVGRLVVAAGSLALWSASATVVAAADPIPHDPGQVLERPLIDVAAVAAGPGGRWVELLTLDAAMLDGGGVRMALIRRDEAWSVVAEASVSFATPEHAESPWLVGIEPDRFAVIQPLDQRDSPDASARRTAVAMVSVDRSIDPPALSVGETVEVELSARGSGAADVDGDGSAEVVLAGEAGDPTTDCPTFAISVISGRESRRVVRQAAVSLDGGVGTVRLAGAALGEWDGRPGMDLLAQGYETCVPTGWVEHHHLVAIRLSDLSTIVDLPSDIVESTGPASVFEPAAPIVVDVDADGRSEAVVSFGPALSIVDPTDGWRRLDIAGVGAVPLRAFERRRGTPSAAVVWIGTVRGGRGSGIRTTGIARVDGSLALVDPGGQRFIDHTVSEVDAMIAAQVRAALDGRSPVVLSADVDLDGCPDLVAPWLFAGCEGTSPPRVGPAFIASRPLIQIGADGDPRLLVAAGLDWFPGSPLDGPTPEFPSPGLVGRSSSWHQRPTIPFYLTEGSLSDLTSASIASSPVVIGTMVSRDGTIDIEGQAGSRVLLRVQDRSPRDVQSSPVRFADSEAFLTTEPLGFERVQMLRLPTPPPDAAGTSVTSTRVPIADAAELTGGASTGPWEVSVVVLDAYGRSTEVAHGVAVYDTEPPTVEVDPPFLSPPWPFVAEIAGTVEAGASVRVGDGAPIAVGASGSFRAETRLAPWPQTVEVTATDRSGNTTVAHISIMGGLDVRRLPWAAIGAVAVLVLVVVSSVRGSRRSPSVAVITTTADGPHLPEIEELAESSLPRHDRP